MKTMDVKRIGTVVASTVMLGAALAAPVSAAADMTGVDKGFFYDANFNPTVQIVVGEKGMATDAVAAGNIAATIGNLAYMTKTETFVPAYEPQGQVVIETAAIGATGDYVQDDTPEETTNVENKTLFYDADVGFYFDDKDVKTYERGDFNQYALACEQQTRTDAGILLEGTYNNIHCLFCKTLCVEGLKNPSHEMKEQIVVDNNMIRYYEEGTGDDDSEALKMAIDDDAIKYVVETGYIPLEDMDTSGGLGTRYADFEYRGKLIFMGNEYYVKEVDSDSIYLAEGKVLDDITSEGYTSEFKGYKFKIDHLIYSGEYEVAGILLDVEKPDGTIVQTQISKMANGVVDDLEIAGVYAEAAGAVETASIIVYDSASEVVLEDDKDLELGGVTYEGWDVEWGDYTGNCSSLPDCDISEYEDYDFEVLEKIEVTLDDAVDGVDALGVDETLNFPSEFMLTFKGFMTSGYKESECSGGDDGILLERGSDVHDLVLSFTADDGNRYDEVSLAEGPFGEGDIFFFDGNVWELEDIDTSDVENEVTDTVEITRKPLVSGSKVKVELTRYCDPDDNLMAADIGVGAGTLQGNCSDTGVITVRKLALLNAMDDEDPTEYAEDDDVEIDTEDLFWANDTGITPSLAVFYDNKKDVVIYAVDGSDLWLTINPDMVGTFSNFDTDLTLYMEVIREANITTDVNSTIYNDEQDLNQDSVVAAVDNGNDDDLLVLFRGTDDDTTEYVVVDFSDRGYDELQIGGYDYKNSVVLYDSFSQTNGTENAAADVLRIEEDEDTLLIAPFTGSTFTVDWGVDNKMDSVDICWPQKAVDATYFLGIGEEATYIEDTVTKDDEGTEVTAGCCTFKVKEFSVDVGGADEQSYTTATVNALVGRMVVPEVGADTTKNLVIVGGPAVNGMCTVTTEEIAAEADKYVVKKDGNLLIVAGYEYEETLAAGDALIEWLNANVH